eukprot:gnl/TRDRNA2_/TRDRNA2_170077_c0_seq1.p1 gnl/TRDRNA2_/TRDRNA2_170077_c0~~gnl/TRDRNA2_/TRDRNA2_170077_c0_seq1.p1  ORF type:complete len:403 (-),score=75.80 gnl/TRDRNA2_/TRDRNA2_170077_c0_seq1:39-1142(-)
MRPVQKRRPPAHHQSETYRITGSTMLDNAITAFQGAGGRVLLLPSARFNPLFNDHDFHAPGVFTRHHMSNSWFEMEVNGPPLHEASAMGHLSSVEHLVAARADPTAKDADGRLPIKEAAAQGHLQVVEFLASFGEGGGHGSELGEIWQVRSREAWNDAVRAAASRGHIEVVELLASLGADLAARDDSGQSLIHYCAGGGQLALVKYLVEARAANPGDTDRDGFSPLHWTTLQSVAGHGHVKVAEFLLDSGAEVLPATNPLSMSPMHWAAVRGHVPLLSLLLDRRADAATKGAYGSLPLHRAAQQGHLPAVEILVRHAKGSHRVPAGRPGSAKRPLEEARVAGHRQVAAYLEGVAAREVAWQAASRAA